MSRTLDARDRLQPSLLDRLTDDEPHRQEDTDERRAISRSALRRAVLRDLAWLFNATRSLPADAAERYREAGRSVLAYGLPPLSGQVASNIDVRKVERSIRDAILRFEPRLAPGSLRVVALESGDVLATHNLIEFEIRALLWGQPVPLEMLLRTRIDLEAGQARLRDVLGSGSVETASPGEH